MDEPSAPPRRRSAEELMQLGALIDRAFEHPADQRRAWLDGLSADAEPLAETLARLIERDAATPLEPVPFTPHGAPPAAGDRVGAYRLLRELGTGGMGAVWLGERADGQMKRQVALKLPHAGWAPALAERFAREREILATLEHPHIARLYDAGVDDQGRPFMALEYVEGEPIDVYCRNRALGLEARVRLLLQVAEAVAFAHGRLVLHRDLKPGNVLVTAAGEVRLLDFGIAKLMADGHAHETALTQAAGRALTLDYASPEQIRGGALGTASDVYSLGVVAYELLAGQRPYRLQRGTAAELEEAIANQHASPASTACDDPAMARRLRGDLDAILNQALEKEPAERYATVDALAQDWRRWLAGERVQARPDSWRQRLARFERRHRAAIGAGTVVIAAFGLALGFGATALVILALLVGLAGALWQARQARRQARIATTEARTAAAVQGFLEHIFLASGADQPDPVAARQRSALELLDEGAARVDRELADAPAARLRVLRVLAGVYEQMVLSNRAAKLFEATAGLAAQLHGERSAAHARALADWADALTRSGRHEGALALLQRAEAACPADDDGARCRIDLAWAVYHVERADVAGLPYAERALGLAGAESEDRADALYLLGALQYLALRYEAAKVSLAASAALAARLPVSDRLVVPATMYLARAQQRLGELDAAERAFRQAMALADAKAGPQSVVAVTVRGEFGHLLVTAGRAAEAIDHIARARESALAWTDADERASHAPHLLLLEARALLAHGRAADAADRAAQALALRRGGDDSDPSHLAWVEGTRAQALSELGEHAAAEEALAVASAAVQEHDLQATRVGFWVRRLPVVLALARGDGAAAARAWHVIDDRDVLRADVLQVATLAAEVPLAAGDAAAALAAAAPLRTTLAGMPPLAQRRDAEARLAAAEGRALLSLGRAAEGLPRLQAACDTLATLHDAAVSRALATALQDLAAARAVVANEPTAARTG